LWAKEHIDTLHFSLAALQKFSQHSIVVLTDTSRNEAPIHHDRLIDIKTPEHYNHHQASIYLKTGLHQFLDKGNTYCYLDTDVVAVSADCDDIFKQRAGLINFAPDHCRLRQFSSYAVNCGCLEQRQKWAEEINFWTEDYYLKSGSSDKSNIKKKVILFQKLQSIRASRIKSFWFLIRLNLSIDKFKLEDDTYYNKKTKQWIDSSNELIYEVDEDLVQYVATNTSYTWSYKTHYWLADGKYDINQKECNHLLQEIKRKFNIHVTKQNWQHWNGGVFLFDDDSHPFLTAWHQKSLQIFNDPAWKIRDQGTLIATAWEFGLQHQALLPKRFNFIADFQNPLLMVDETNNLVSDNIFKTSHAASFVHVFNRFGDKGWFFWKWVLNQYK
jgi:hypothetical protein